VIELLVLIAFLPLLVTPTNARAGNSPAFASHLLAPDPEWQAMRGARSATGPGLAASLGNPAAIGSLIGEAAACTHLQWAGGLSREWAGAGRPVGRGVVAAFDAAVLRSPELPGYDVDGNPTSPFRAAEWSAAVRAAVSLGRGVGIGAGARVFRLEDSTEPLTGTGFSFGIQARGAGRTAGLALTDVGAPMRGPQGVYALPTCWRAGFEQELAGERVLVAASLESAISGNTHGALGVIMRPVSSLELLGGLLAQGSVAGEAPLGWSAGITVHRGPLAVSYAFRQEEALGATHIVGLRMELRSTRNATRTSHLDTPAATLTSRPAGPVAPAPSPTSKYAAFGGRYRSADAAGPEVALIRREGFPDARPVPDSDGSWRVLVLKSPTAHAVDVAVAQLRARAIVVTAEILDASAELAP
jgi:hypothetical protein